MRPTYNGASYNIYTNEYNRFTPKTSSGDKVSTGVGIYDIWYDTSTRIILYSAGGSSSEKVEYNVILSTKGASSMKTLTSDELSYAATSVTHLASGLDFVEIASTVTISANTRIYIQFTKWLNQDCNGVFYLGEYTPAEFNQ